MESKDALFFDAMYPMGAAGSTSENTQVENDHSDHIDSNEISEISK